MPLCVPDRPSLGGGLLGEPGPPILVAHLKDRAAVALGQVSALEQGERWVGEVEQADQVGDRGAAATWSG